MLVQTMSHFLVYDVHTFVMRNSFQLAAPMSAIRVIQFLKDGRLLTSVSNTDRYDIWDLNIPGSEYVPFGLRCPETDTSAAAIFDESCLCKGKNLCTDAFYQCTIGTAVKSACILGNGKFVVLSSQEVYIFNDQSVLESQKRYDSVGLLCPFKSGRESMFAYVIGINRICINDSKYHCTPFQPYIPGFDFYIRDLVCTNSSLISLLSSTLVCIWDQRTGHQTRLIELGFFTSKLLSNHEKWMCYDMDLTIHVFP